MSTPNLSIRAVILSLMASAVVCHGELLVYEPFDYQPHNDEVFGRLEGRNGGKGFSGPWMDTGGDTGNGGYAYIYDERGNPEDLYDGGWGKGQPDWDGMVDNLPTMGGYVGGSDWNGGYDRINSSRKLSKSAGEMAKKNGGVLWLSSVWHFPEHSYFAPVSIALTSKDGGIKDRAFGLTNGADGIGTGNGQDFRKGMKRLNPMIWEKGKDVAKAIGTDVDRAKDNIVILKFEFGETDKVSVWYFTEDQEFSEEAFNANAISCAYSIDEFALDTLAFGTIRTGNAVDEIRIGTDFQSVISGSIPPRQEVKITKLQYDAGNGTYSLQWTSNPGEVYGVYLAEDAGGYKPCVAAAVEAEDGKKVTSLGPFPSPRRGDGKLKFEIGLPDLTPPVMDRVWGHGSIVSLHFSEPMLPTSALVPENYTVTSSGGGTIAVDTAKFDPGNNTVVLSTAKPLDRATTYTITTRNLIDRANLPLTNPTISLTTWDDDPNGVKVFILAGQSNMIGRGHYDKGQGDEIGGVGSLREQINKSPDKLGYLLDGNGDWKELDGMKFFWNRAEPGNDPKIIQGNMKVGYGAGPDCIGPEFGFAWAIHQHMGNQPVLVIKAAWGGKSLHTDFCSPSAAAIRDGRIGPYYLQMMESVRLVLNNLGEYFPEFEGKGYQITGFGWHQGYNDMLNDVMTKAYEQNMAMFIRDIRAEFGKPGLPFSIATTGHGGMEVTLEDRPTLAGQLAVADPKQYPEFAGNVFTVDSRPFQRTPEVSPRSDGSHWHNNGETLWLIGKGMGDGMVEMLKK